ncbi:MAG: pantetheine-phosphate adenylyltransferase [Bacteroidales bacterium]|jgi:pantetheine-phosphate adenylyltransferase|nr:pantetheine-phosphate adenylyltransferase [Bacteroidales bacterium]
MSQEKISKIAVFPGSFDPITIGHEAIIRRALPLFDKIIVAIGKNTVKKNLFALEDRMEWIKIALKEFEDKVEVAAFDGLTMNFCKERDAQFILRGLRTSVDFEFEYSISQINRQIGDIETIFLFTDPVYTPISSSIVRDIYLHGGDFSSLIPKGIKLIKNEE